MREGRNEETELIIVKWIREKRSDSGKLVSSRDYSALMTDRVNFVKRNPR